MPVNVAFTFLIGGILGWIAVKVLGPKPHLEGLIIATCASGQLNYIHIDTSSHLLLTLRF